MTAVRLRIVLLTTGNPQIKTNAMLMTWRPATP